MWEMIAFFLCGLVCPDVCFCVQVCVLVFFLCVCMYVCMCIFIYMLCIRMCVYGSENWEQPYQFSVEEDRDVAPQNPNC